jgi:hypothetical protein
VGSGRSAIVRSEEGVAFMVHAHAGVGVSLSNQEGKVVRCVIWVLEFAWFQGEAVRKHCIVYEKEEGEIAIVIRNKLADESRAGHK